MSPLAPLWAGWESLPHAIGTGTVRSHPTALSTSDLRLGCNGSPGAPQLPKCQSILWPFPPLPAALTAAAGWALTAQGPGALRTPMGQTGVTSPSAPSPYLQHPYWEHALWLSCVSHRCLSSLSSSGRSLPSHHRAAKAGKDVTQVRAGVAVTPCSHGIRFGPPLADPLFASTAGVPFSVRLRGPFTWGASGGIQREGTQDLSHRQGERCPGRGTGQRLQLVCMGTRRVP